MSIKTYKPTTPGRRGMSALDNSALSKAKPTKSLLRKLPAKSGRNNQGQITTRHRGGGVKRFYRLVDFKALEGQELTVKSIEYDPYRSANLALVEDKAGKLSYILAPARVKVGKVLEVGKGAAITSGNRLQLKNIPLGTAIYNIELTEGRGGQLVRSAGTNAQLTAKEGKYAQIKLPSGEVRMVLLSCYATIGSVGNEQHQNIKWGSAGRKRRLGVRPTVRGKAMNPVDHPLGGGEGVSGPGRIPRTPWGKTAIGGNTRRRKQTSKYIIRGRKQGRR